MTQPTTDRRFRAFHFYPIEPSWLPIDAQKSTTRSRCRCSRCTPGSWLPIDAQKSTTVEAAMQAVCDQMAIDARAGIPHDPTHYKVVEYYQNKLQQYKTREGHYDRDYPELSAAVAVWTPDGGWRRLR